MPPSEALPLTSLQSVILTTGPLVFLWTYCKSYVDRRGGRGFGWAETIYDTHNFVLAGVSLVLAAYVLDIGHNILTAKTGYEVDPSSLAYAYHLLKIYQYFDIILAVLVGNTQVSKYEAFSHLFMPYWSYYRVIKNDALDWRFQVIADCSVRFLSRVIPWLVEDVTTEEIILNMAEEWRWYPDLAISAFWAFFTFQNQRESEAALKLFGKPRNDEVTARALSVAILLYAGYAKRREDAKKLQAIKTKESAKSSEQEDSDVLTSSPKKAPTRTSPRLKRRH